MPGQTLLRTHITSPWSAADPSHSCAVQQHPTSSSPVPFPFSESLWSPHGKPQSTGSGASERMPQPPVPWTDSSERCSLHFSSGVPVESSSCCSFLPRHTLTAISLPHTAIRSNRSALRGNVTSESSREPSVQGGIQQNQYMESDFSLMFRKYFSNGHNYSCAEYW